jgi:PAS domain S-box-containing protein
MEFVGCLFLLVGLWSLWLNGRPDRYAWWTIALIAALVGATRTLGEVRIPAVDWGPAFLLGAGVVEAGGWAAGAVRWPFRRRSVGVLVALGAIGGILCWALRLGPPFWVVASITLVGSLAAVAGALAKGERGLLLVALVLLAGAEGLDLIDGAWPGWLPGAVIAVGHVVAQLVLGTAVLRYELAIRQGIVEQLSRSEEHFRMIFEHSGVAMALLTPRGGFVRVNPAMVELFGYQVEELQGRLLLDLMGHDPLRSSRTEQGLDLPQGVYERERYFQRKDGQLVLAQVLRVPLRDSTGAVRYLVAVVLDMTEHRRAEAALAASEARYRLRFEAASDGLFTCTVRGKLLAANPAFSRLTGMEPGSAGDRNLAELVDDAPRLLQHLGRAMEKGADRVEMHLRIPDGSTRAIEIVSSVLVQDGQPVLCGSVRDIDERKRAEEALRRADERLRRERDFWTQVVGTSAALILVLDAQGRLVQCNAAARDVARAGQELLAAGGTLEELFPQPLAATLRGRLERLVRQAGTEAFEAPVPGIDGHDRWIAWRISSAHRDGEPGLVVLTGVDVTDQRNLEEQLRQAQKMECLGTLVGGIAHDFNNQLAIVLGNLDLLTQESRGNGTPRREVADAEHAARRCADMTQSLLAFSRRRAAQLRQLYPAALLGEIAPLLQRVLPATIQVDIEIRASLWHVQADSTQIHQVLMNLAINARDAMSTGGRLRIALADRTLRPGDTLPHPQARPGQFVVLTVADSGTGMTAEVRARAFEPFFTTKEVGKGTGLGLPVVFGIVQSHQGWITLESEPGRGTTFEIWLPAVMPASEPLPEVFDIPPVRGGIEFILLVDDEEMLRGLGRSVLERWGYRVLTACNGEEALATLRQFAGDIRLVVLDLNMPGLTGLQLLPLVRGVIPGLRVIFSSGHGDAEALIQAGANAFLPKPYHPDELVRLVRRVLDAPAPRSDRNGIH